MSSRVMKLVSDNTSKMECMVCGSDHYASIRRGGGYCRGAWSCAHGCRLPSKTEPQAFNGWSQKWVNPEDMHIPKAACSTPT